MESSYFINRAHICLALGDILGSAKLNEMTGHSAIYSDWFSMVTGAKSSLDKGAKVQYYPILPPCNSIYNPEQLTSYDLLGVGQCFAWHVTRPVVDVSISSSSRVF